VTISLCRSLLLGLSLVLAACGGEGLTLPPDGAAAHIEILSGNGQSARVGSPLPEPLVVKVTDTQNRPVAGASVVFEFTADGSAASPASISTDANGQAASQLVLGTRVGPVSGAVKVPVEAGVSPVEAAITATAVSDDANGIALVSGDDQSGAVGTTLSLPLVVVVADKFGNPIPGVTVEWSVTGGGSVSAATTVSGENGQASVTRTLGPTAGEQTTLATAAGLAGSPVTFSHTATAGTATGVVKVSGDQQSALAGTELANPLVVQVLDGQQNPIPGRAVTWIVTGGGGSVPSENTTTDAQGFASTSWTLGGSAGPNSLNAVVSGVGSASFTATATAGTPSASNSAVSASPATINAVTGSSTITVTVRDAGNNPVSGVSVTPASTGSGNTFNPTTANAGANGVATFTFSSTVAESKTITATAGGVAITDQATVTVQKVSSSVEITSDEPDPSSVNDQVTVEFTVTGTGGTPTGVVTITVSGGPETCSESLTSGSGSCTVTLLVPGTGTGFRRVITASYAGDSQFAPDTDTDNHRVDPLPVPNNAPTAEFTFSCTNLDCSFADASTDGDGTVTNWSWDFGHDGSTSNSQSPSHTFPAAGSYNVKLTVRDNDNATDDVTHQVTVTEANAAPTAIGDAYTTSVDAGFHAPGANGPSLIANDTDPNGDPLSTTPVAAAATANGGSVTIGSDGSFDYIPPTGFTGTDSFTYTVNDGRGGSDTGLATITIG